MNELQECLKRLADKFPASPRVDCLQGIFLEGTQSPQLALKYYGKLLETDPANAVSPSYSVTLVRGSSTVSSARQHGSAGYLSFDGWVR